MEAANGIEWKPAVEKALRAPGVVVLLGGVDTGKTTLAMELANTALGRGMRIGVIDADVGQSAIGPPGTVGLALPRAPVTSGMEWRPAALAFVGATSPPGRLLDIITGTRRLADVARQRGAELIIVDTSGLIRGTLALKLKLAKLETLQPSVILALRRGPELDAVLRLAPAVCGGAVVPLAPAADVRSKPQGLRRARRAAGFAQHLREASLHEIDPRRVPVMDGWLFSGRALEPRTLRAAATLLRREVPYGEETPDGVRLVTRGLAPPLARTDWRELFGSRRVDATPAQTFQHLLVGLLEEGGRLAEIGLLQEVDFARGLLHVLSPLRSEGALRALQYGRLRLRADGSEIGPVRAGDL